jgi:hypothetical protein
MAGNYPFHGKLHRSTHHTVTTPGLIESATDPIASFTAPFRGIFYTLGYGDSYQWFWATNYMQNNSARWNSEFTSVTANSASWQSVYSTVNTFSASWEESIFITPLQNASGSWNSVYTTVRLNSAFWNRYLMVYTVLYNNSASWNSVYVTFNSNSSKYESTYATVNSNSATVWNYQGADIKTLTGNWDSNYTTVNTYSASWGSVLMPTITAGYYENKIQPLTLNQPTVQAAISALHVRINAIYNILQGLTAGTGTVFVTITSTR